MGLRTNIIGVAADTTEDSIDLTVYERGTYDLTVSPATYTKTGTFKITKTTTTKTWVANTKAACDAYVDYYKAAGKASFSITVQNAIINSYQLAEVTTTTATSFTAVT